MLIKLLENFHLFVFSDIHVRVFATCYMSISCVNNESDFFKFDTVYYFNV